MAFSTKCDEVGLAVIPKCATPYRVVNIEILRASTILTAPTISLQNFSPQPCIKLRRLTNSGPFLQDGITHVARFLRMHAAQVLRASHGWVTRIRDSVPIRPSPRQHQQENRRRSFRANSLEIYCYRA
jgi:hypothetical protein